MAVRELATYEQALERISELEEAVESLDALLLLGERAAGDNGTRHALADVARKLPAQPRSRSQPADAQIAFYAGGRL